jgi:hypothetical protein
LALSDLAQCLAPELRAQWLQALQSRISKARSTAQSYPEAQRDGLLAMATSMEYLHKSLAEFGLPQKSDD